MADVVLEAQPRTVVGKKVKTLRNQGLVPVSVYGPKIDPVKLQVPYRALEVALMKAGGTSLIDIKVDKDIHTVLAREVQRQVVRGDILHVDFFAVDVTAVLTADIPVHLIGESPVVDSGDGILLTGTNTVTIETLPGKLMDFIEVDLSRLTEIGDSITVADLDLGDDIRILNDPEDMLARVATTSAARADMLEEMEEGDELDEEIDRGAEPEVISRGRDEDEDE